jgi:uncharacterized peroxidase-related enzyme
MWISHIPYSESNGRLRSLYDRIKGPDGNIDNIMLAHSLRAHSMEGHMALYKYVLHHSGNVSPKWFLEALGVHASLLNGCDYCVEHHFAGLRRLLKDDFRATVIRSALERVDFGDIFSAPERAALDYATVLTQAPQQTAELKLAFEAMRAAGMDDGQILEINQVVAYFNYANRTVLGLGVTTNGNVLGLSPGNSDDMNDWAHR